MLALWGKFFGLAVVIGFSGYFLSYYAEKISDQTRLSKNWMGLILIAAITSLPELATGVSAVRLTGNVNLAMGNILGGCIFNLVLLFILEIFYRKKSIYLHATIGHILAATLGIVLMSFLGAALLLSQSGIELRIGYISGYTAVIPLIYLWAIGFLQRVSPSQNQEAIATPPDQAGALAKSILLFLICAVAILGTGINMPFLAEQIIETMGWNSAFVGTVFIALATSLPEIAVTFSAIRLNAIELAIGNVLGSNLFNIVILALDDFAYPQGSLLEEVSKTHLSSVFVIIFMTAVVVTGLVQPPKQRILSLSSAIGSILILSYLINIYLIYKTS